jgi:antitoxin component YwqK of YwqJK toxin-antitoxin module
MNRPKVVPDSELDFDPDLIFTHNGELFTGISYEENPEIGRCEISYRDGMQAGWARDWYPSKVLKSESYYVRGVPHGPSRDFDSSGSLSIESNYEYGIRVLTRHFNSEGQVTATEEIDPNDGAFELLERYRVERRWDPQWSAPTD